MTTPKTPTASTGGAIEFERDGRRLHLRVGDSDGVVPYIRERATSADLIAALSSNAELREQVLGAFWSPAEVTENAERAAKLWQAIGEPSLRKRAEAAESDLDFLANHMSTDWTNRTDAGGKAMLRLQSAELQAEELRGKLETVKEDRRLQRVRAADAETALTEARAELERVKLKAEAWSELEEWVMGLSGSATRSTAEIMRAMARAEHRASLLATAEPKPAEHGALAEAAASVRLDTETRCVEEPAPDSALLGPGHARRL
jgi:hypothetical protein